MFYRGREMSFARRAIWLCIPLGAAAAVMLAIVLSGCKKGSKEGSGAITYHQHIEPIVSQNCAVCHHPGESAPFALLNYEDVKKHATQIAKVTQSHFMPPWLPEHGYGDFADERRLSDEQIQLIAQWVKEGAVEGKPTGAPTTQKWNEGWRLGQPDMIAQMPQAYTLPAEGKDVYRNFVVPLSMDTSRWVRAVELHAGNKQVVHHSFIMFDISGSARRSDAQDAEIGYPGMDAGEDVGVPGGQFLSWQPGKQPSLGSEARSWRLPKGADMVLQMHMRPGGKAEPVQSTVGFYFTEKPPEQYPFVLVLRSTAIDIPPGEKNYVIESSYTLPVDVELTGILPHAHYLGRELAGNATLPDGSQRPLILIKNWDFNWQGDYRYKTPMALPKGTKVSMRFSYDNSSENVRNPSHPPKPVRYGLESTDEMGELWLQLVPKSREEMLALSGDYMKNYGIPDSIARCQNLLKHSPNDAALHTELSAALAKAGRTDEAQKEMRRALELDSKNVKAHFNLGNVLYGQGKVAEAMDEFQTVLRLDPDHYRTHNNLGMIYAAQGKLDLAGRHFYNAVRVNPNDLNANLNLARLFLHQRNWGQARLALETILNIDPDNAAAKTILAQVQAELEKSR
jgi:Tfp pilus assembly protein PilF/mono/diheme cytochrome c family protein